MSKPLSRRQARRRLGTRSGRRSGTNGKNIRKFPDGRAAPLGNSGRVIFKYLNPRPASRKVAVGVARLMAGSR